MSNKQAFPLPHVQLGMTLREYYAAHAPVTLADVLPLLREDGPGLFEKEFRSQALRVLAQLRFEYADAMIARGGGV